MRVTFWGVRGTHPATGAQFARFGGDTMCVEVACGDARIVLDAGSGLRALGMAIAAREARSATHLFLSHLHLDHIIGLPQFQPLWQAGSALDIHVGAGHAPGWTEEAALAILRPPYFPVTPPELPAAVTVQPFVVGDAVTPTVGVTVRTFALSHGGESTGLRIEWGGRSVCYVTDHEHGDVDTGARLAKAVAGADLLIYDATYTDGEMPSRRGWGHSSWEEGLRLKRRAGVGMVAFAHHDPDRTDGELDVLSEAAASAGANAVFARRGMSIEI
jgi:phosphoribosyl 1,2-cyclic phosphodiesterase